MRCAMFILLIAAVYCQFDEDGELIPEFLEPLTTFEDDDEPQTTPEPVQIMDTMLNAADASCSAGFYSPSGFATCIQCEKGTFSSATRTITACDLCAPGKFAAVDGMIQCSQCPAGSFSYFSGSSACSDCPQWTGSVAGSSACVTCWNTTQCLYADKRTCPGCGSACSLCNAGYYNDGVTGGVCSQCGSGTYNSAPGASSSGQCVTCGTGTFLLKSKMGMTACTSCSTSTGYPAPPNAVYIESTATGGTLQDTYSPYMCIWKCNTGGYELQKPILDETSPEWTFYYSTLTNTKNQFNDAEARLMISLKFNYCCNIAGVGTGRRLVGCSRLSTGVVEDCPVIVNGYYEDPGSPMVDKCGYWKCNNGFYKSGTFCVAQPVCDSGMTYLRGDDGVKVADPGSGMYSCVTCPVCADGTESAIPCNSTNMAVCRHCGNKFSVQGGVCLDNVPLGFRPVSQSRNLAIIPLGQRPTLDSTNTPMSSTLIRIFNSYITCDYPGNGLSFTGGDASCALPVDASCLPCNTQCTPWTRTGGWFEGVGFYGDKNSGCASCSFSPDLCGLNQYLEMSTCGPTSSPQCKDCGKTVVEFQAGWTKPTDAAWAGKYPCKVVCTLGYSEYQDTCIQCTLPENVVLTNGCNWECKPGYLKNSAGTGCVACPPSVGCNVGFYKGFNGLYNVCASCLACDRIPDSTFTTNGTSVTSCGFKCNSGFYLNRGVCNACTSRTCVLRTSFYVPCTDSLDSQCRSCKACVIGEKVEQACNLTNDTVCSRCDTSLLPANASWTDVGCVNWACTRGFWLDGSVCRKCNETKDCTIGTRPETVNVCVIDSSTTATYKCTACNPLLPGYEYTGDASCTTRLVGSTSKGGGVTSTSRQQPSTNVTAVNNNKTATIINNKTATIINNKTATIVMNITSATVNNVTTPYPVSSSTSTPLVTEPQTTPPPVAYATVAELSIKPTENITSALLASLVDQVSQSVCPGLATCNVSVLSITRNNVTVYCANGACPLSMRRLLQTDVGTSVNMGIVTSAAVQDLAPVFNSIPTVAASNVQPNMPLTDTMTIQDPQNFIALVRALHTVYVIVPVSSDSSNLVLVVAVVVSILVVAGAVVLIFYFRSHERIQVAKAQALQPLIPVSNAANHARFPPLESIRITKENFKPYIKTA